MKNKKEIELWDVKDMYEYGLKIYQIEEDLKNNVDYKESAVRQIRRTLEDYHFAPVKGNNKREKYQVPADIARFIVQD